MKLKTQNCWKSVNLFDSNQLLLQHQKHVDYLNKLREAVKPSKDSARNAKGRNDFVLLGQGLIQEKLSDATHGGGDTICSVNLYLPKESFEERYVDERSKDREIEECGDINTAVNKHMLSEN